MTKRNGPPKISGRAAMGRSISFDGVESLDDDILATSQVMQGVNEEQERRGAETIRRSCEEIRRRRGIDEHAEPPVEIHSMEYQYQRPRATKI
jgi:hypothetical protein